VRINLLRSFRTLSDLFLIFSHAKKIKIAPREPEHCMAGPLVRGGRYQKVKKLSPLIGVMIKFKVYETHFL
jgi:hypothetical protein